MNRRGFLKGVGVVAVAAALPAVALRKPLVLYADNSVTNLTMSGAGDVTFKPEDWARELQRSFADKAGKVLSKSVDDEVYKALTS